MEERKGRTDKKPLIEEDNDDFHDPPPSYKEAQQHLEATPIPTVPESSSRERRRHRNLFAFATSSKSPTAEFKPPEKPIQFLPPDPTRIKCCCGRHVDTTDTSQSFPIGWVRCKKCRYYVHSSGCARHDPPWKPCPRESCTGTVSLPTMKATACKCGVILELDGSFRLPGEHTDPTRVKCICGVVNDTTQECKVSHQDGRKMSEYTYVSHRKWVSVSPNQVADSILATFSPWAAQDVNAGERSKATVRPFRAIPLHVVDRLRPSDEKILCGCACSLVST